MRNNSDIACGAAFAAALLVIMWHYFVAADRYAEANSIGAAVPSVTFKVSLDSGYPCLHIYTPRGSYKVISFTRSDTRALAHSLIQAGHGLLSIENKAHE